MQWLIWAVWLVIMIVGNVVFMNFIIAVVSESFTKSMAMQTAQSYRLKVPLIVEQERDPDKSELMKAKNFPNYIIVKTPANQVSENATEE
jgi:hypothetical protein